MHSLEGDSVEWILPFLSYCYEKLFTQQTHVEGLAENQTCMLTSFLFQRNMPCTHVPELLVPGTADEHRNICRQVPRLAFEL